MPGSIRDKVAIVGMGCTQFGELWNKGPTDLIVDAVNEALADAGITMKDVQAAWGGTLFSGTGGRTVSEALRSQYIPITRVENACGSGHEAVSEAAVRLETGDVIVFPQGDAHVLSSKPGMRGRPDLGVYAATAQMQLPIAFHPGPKGPVGTRA